MMATNVTEKDKTLQEVIDWCTDWAKELCADIEGDCYANFMQADALTMVIAHCQSMLDNGSMTTEVPNQSKDVED